MMNEPTYVIASDRPWSRDLPGALARQCKGRFVLINDKDDLSEETLRSLAPRYVFFPHWSSRIPAAIHERFECIIFHMTDVPYGRGGSPLQNLIARGHSDTVIAALRAVAEMDAGPVYDKRTLCLHGSAEEIFLRAATVIEEMIKDIVIDEPHPLPQEGSPVVFQRRQSEDGNLRQAQDLNQLYDQIRMLDAEGYPPAFLKVGPFKLEFRRASRRTSRVEADVRITFCDDSDNE